MKICLKNLREEYAQCDFTMSDPVVSYRETVGNTSGQTCLANRIYLVAEPLEEELSVASEKGTKEHAKVLREKYSWDESNARTIR